MGFDDARTMGELTVKTLRVPARCRNGHHLEPRTTYVRHTTSRAVRVALVPLGWECCVCVRVRCWTAQFPGRAVPDDLLEPESYAWQPLDVRARLTPEFAAAVHFESGWQLTGPDSTPAARAEKARAAAEAERKAAAEQEQRAQEAARQRERQVRREHADESLRAIRGLMGAA